MTMKSRNIPWIEYEMSDHRKPHKANDSKRPRLDMNELTRRADATFSVQGNYQLPLPSAKTIYYDTKK